MAEDEEVAEVQPHDSAPIVKTEAPSTELQPFVPPPAPTEFLYSDQYQRAEELSRKRAMLYSSPSPQSKKARPSLATDPLGLDQTFDSRYKNPMELFNHIFAGDLPKFTFENFTNPETKLPVFQATITVNGRSFLGEGGSKKDAKQMCAYEYIRSKRGDQYANWLLASYQSTGKMATKSPAMSSTVLLPPSGPEEDNVSHLMRICGNEVYFEDAIHTTTRNGMVVSVAMSLANGAQFVGEGPNEGLARNHAATLALIRMKQDLPFLRSVQYQPPPPSVVKPEPQRAPPPPPPLTLTDQQYRGWNQQSYSEDYSFAPVAQFSDPAPPPALHQLPVKPEPARSMPVQRSIVPSMKETIEGLLKDPNANALSVFNQIAGPAVQWIFLEERGEKQMKEFVLKTVLDGREHTVTGRSKKDAKLKAALKMLREHYGVDATPVNMANKSVIGDEAPNADFDSSTHYGFANTLQQMVKEKFLELTRDSQFNKWKVLAGIFLTSNEAWDDPVLLCCTTGTKTLSGERLSMSGSVLHDCHAEILARRCVRRFLCSELNKMADPATAPHSIFQPCRDQGYRLKPGYRFHLYVSTTTCGDARVFSPHEASDGADSGRDRRSRGQLRVKIEAGEGTIPSASDDFDPVQTFDGVLAGNRLLNMSCSDKVLKMNVMGIQGALLSWFIEPIYLSSIVIGACYHAEHLHRAMIGRFNQPMSAPFRAAQPLLCNTETQEARQPAKAPPYAHNWTCLDKDPEIIDTSSGRTMLSNEVSSLSKREMYSMFKALYERLNTRIARPERTPSTYRDWKRAAKDYADEKEIFIKTLEQKELGRWLRKPREVGDF